MTDQNTPPFAQQQAQLIPSQQSPVSVQVGTSTSQSGLQPLVTETPPEMSYEMMRDPRNWVNQQAYDKYWASHTILPTYQPANVTPIPVDQYGNRLDNRELLKEPFRSATPLGSIEQTSQVFNPKTMLNPVSSPESWKGKTISNAPGLKPGWEPYSNEVVPTRQANTTAATPSGASVSFSVAEGYHVDENGIVRPNLPTTTYDESKWSPLNTNTGLQAQAENIQYRYVNQPGSVSQAEMQSIPGQAVQNAYGGYADYDAYQEALKRQRAFSNPLAGIDPSQFQNMSQEQIAKQYGQGTADAVSEYYRANPSQRYLDIVAQYQQQHYIGHNPNIVYDPKYVLTSGQEQQIIQTGTARGLEGISGSRMNELAGRVSAGLAAGTITVGAAYDLYGRPTNPAAEVEQAARNAQGTPWQIPADTNTIDRAGYTPLDKIGDRWTQFAAYGLEVLSLGKMNREQALGTVLVGQYEAAKKTPGISDDQYYNVELQKLVENKVEYSSWYHHEAYNRGIPIPANPYEYSGDLAVEFLKGTPKRESEFFSPVSGEMGQYLPNGQGIQDAAWETARTQQPSGLSFGSALAYLNEQVGKFGPYGTLWGGPEYKETGHNQPSYGGGGIPGLVPAATAAENVGFGVIEPPRPFISTAGDVSYTTKPKGEIFGYEVPVISGILAAFQPEERTTIKYTATELPKTTTFGEPYTEKTEIPGGFLYTTYYPSTTTGGASSIAEKSTVPVAGSSWWDTINTQAREFMHLPEKGVGETALTFAVSAQLPILAFPGIIESAMKGVPVGEASTTRLLNPASGVYSEFYEKPLQAPLMYGVGAAFGGATEGISKLYNVGKLQLAERAIAEGGIARAGLQIGEYAPKVFGVALGGLYAADVAGRTTEGFTQFAPESVAPKARGIVFSEIVPMGAGFGAPRTVYESAKVSDINYKSALQEGATTGRFDYYIKEPATRPVEALKNDYLAYKQENTPVLTPEQKITKDVLDVMKSGTKPGTNEQAFIYSRVSGERLGTIKGTSTSEIKGQDIVDELTRVNSKIPEEETLAVYHTHPRRTIGEIADYVKTDIDSGISSVKAGELTPTGFVKEAPRVMYESAFDIPLTTPSDVDVSRLRFDSSTFGIEQEGIISGGKLTTYATEVGGKTTPSKLYKIFYEGSNKFTATASEKGFLKTGAELGFEPSIRTRAEMIASLPEEPSFFKYAVERVGLNKAPAYSEPTRLSIPRGEYSTEGAYGKPRTVFDYFTKSSGYSEPSTLGETATVFRGGEATRVVKAVPESTAFGVTEKAYGKPSTIFDYARAKLETPVVPEAIRPASEGGMGTSFGQPDYYESLSSEYKVQPVQDRFKAFTMDFVENRAASPFKIFRPTEEIQRLNAFAEFNTKSFEGGVSPTIKMKPLGGSGTSKLTTRIVGGKATSALKPESSLAAMERATTGTTTKIGTRMEAKPPTGPMKPFEGGKQASTGQFLITEQLPAVEGMPTARMAGEQARYPLFAGINVKGSYGYEEVVSTPSVTELQVGGQARVQQQRKGVGIETVSVLKPQYDIASVVTPSLEFKQGSRQRQDVTVIPRSISGQRGSVSEVETQTRRRRRDEEKAFRITPDVARIRSPDESSKIEPYTISGLKSEPSTRYVPALDVGTTPRLDITTRTTPTTTPTIIPKTVPWVEPVVTPIEIPKGFGGIPTGGGGGSSAMRKRRFNFLEIFPMGLDIAAYGKKRVPRRVGKSAKTMKKLKRSRKK